MHGRETHGWASRKPLSTKNSTIATRNSPIALSSRSVRPGAGQFASVYIHTCSTSDGQRGEAAQTIECVQTGARNPGHLLPSRV